jgi:hypothetical protein
MFSQKTEAIAIGTKYQQVKKHVEENKTTYLVGAGCLVTGILVGYGILNKPPVQVINSVRPIFNNKPVIAPVMNNQQVNFGGHMTKLVKCLETGEVWETVTEAAKSNDASLSLMSRHLNGAKPDVYGQHFKIIGVGTTG